MKIIIAIVFSFAATAGFSQEIKGTLMLKGALKTKITVNTVPTTCKLKIEKVTNILTEEDSYGNPGYQAKIKITLDGSDFERSLKVKLDKELMIDNMHKVGDKKVVKDFEYKNAAGDVKVLIDDEGRLLETTFPYEKQTIRCVF